MKFPFFFRRSKGFIKRISKLVKKYFVDDFVVYLKASRKYTPYELEDALKVTSNLTLQIRRVELSEEFAVSGKPISTMKKVSFSDDFQVLTELRKRTKEVQLEDDLIVSGAILQRYLNLTLSDALSIDSHLESPIAAVKTLSAEDSLYFGSGLRLAYTSKVEINLADEFLISDSLVKHELSIDLEEGLVVSDSIRREVEELVLEDSLTISDELLEKVSSVSCSDSLGVSDALRKTIKRVTLSDELRISDMLVKWIYEPIDPLKNIYVWCVSTSCYIDVYNEGIIIEERKWNGELVWAYVAVEDMLCDPEPDWDYNDVRIYVYDYGTKWGLYVWGTLGDYTNEVYYKGYGLICVCPPAEDSMDRLCAYFEVDKKTGEVIYHERYY